MTETLILTLHIIVAFLLILIVLLQTGKGASIGAAFGGSSQTVFGSRGPASFLSKITTAAAIFFMLTSLTLSMLAAEDRAVTIIDDIIPPAATQDELPIGAPSDSVIDPFETLPPLDEAAESKDTGE
jgi:preprotein translocase subunit SecG